MRLSVIIPVYNEEKTIRRVVERISKLDLEKEIVAVNDGSNDQTGTILGQLNKKYGVKVYTHNKNRGKGAAVRTGIHKARGDYVVIHDADLEYNPREILKLLKIAEKNELPVVYGSRFKGRIENMSLPFLVGNIFLTFLTNVLFGVKLTDMETCYKLFEKEVIKGLNWQAERFDFEPEITARILNKGIKIYETPIAYKARKKNEGKKIGFRDGIKAVRVLLKLRFFPEK